MKCGNCSKSIKVKIFNAGLSDAVPFTCDLDSTVLTVATWDKTLLSVLGGYPQSGWTEKHYRLVEAQLRRCPCGGTFGRDTVPKCPKCGTDVRAEGLARSEFVVVERLIDGEKEDPWHSSSKAQVSTLRG